MIDKERAAYIHIFEQTQFDEERYKKEMLAWLETLSRKAKRLQNSIECYRRFRAYDDLQHAIEDMREIRETINKFSDTNELCSHQPNFPADRFFERGITV